jgi:hypothetical protein
LSTINGTDLRVAADVDGAGVLEAGADEAADDVADAVEDEAELVVEAAIDELCATAEVCSAA